MNLELLKKWNNTLLDTPFPKLRKTKRRITQDIKEWDEDDNGSHQEEPELDWGFMEDGEAQPGLLKAFLFGSRCIIWYILGTPKPRFWVQKFGGKRGPVSPHFPGPFLGSKKRGKIVYTIFPLLIYIEYFVYLWLFNPQPIAHLSFGDLLLQGLASGAVEDADTKPVQVETEEVKKEMSKLNFPTIEADMAPSAIAPKACNSLQKHLGKVDGLLAVFTASQSLTTLQERSLD